MLRFEDMQVSRGATAVAEWDETKQVVVIGPDEGDGAGIPAENPRESRPALPWALELRCARDAGEDEEDEDTDFLHDDEDEDLDEDLDEELDDDLDDDPDDDDLEEEDDF
ncbi:MAG TPA: hypothetical protein VLM89_05765 [Phycisphaerae bacterium]|nr:hypothetical protein [Phycisphaerae bacterium]